MDTDRARHLLASQWSVQRGVSFDGLSLSTVAGRPFARFDRCTFVNTDLRHATLDRVHFKLCDLTGADLRAASLRGAVFSGCDLRGADLRDTDLTGARFTFVDTGGAEGRTDVTGAELTSATLQDVTVECVIGWKGLPELGRA